MLKLGLYNIKLYTNKIRKDTTSLRIITRNISTVTINEKMLVFINYICLYHQRTRLFYKILQTISLHFNQNYI